MRPVGVEDTFPSAELTPEELCRRYAHRVYQFAVMVARNGTEAEDLAQEALIRAIRHLDRFDPDRGDVERWLWRIVANVARDAGRVKRRHVALVRQLIERYPAALIEPDCAVHLGDEDLLDAIRALEPRARALIALRFGADLDYAAVGEALGLSPAAARMATRRAVDTLRRSIEAKEDRNA